LRELNEALASYSQAKAVAIRRGGEMTAALGRRRPPSRFAGYRVCLDFVPLYLGTAGFYLGLLALALSSVLREKFQSVFSLPTPANQPVIKPFDAIRGLSALWVAFGHFDYFLAGFNVIPRLGRVADLGRTHAVPVFATLSAFLIFRSVKTISSASDLLAYLKRRWLRIYPLYFVTSLAIATGGYFVFRPGWERICSDLLMLRLMGRPFFLNPAAWSLYVEEGFYLAIPLWAACFRDRAALGAALSYAAVSVLAAHVPSREADLLRFFCVGILLAKSLERPARLGAAARWAVLAGGSALFLAAVSGAVAARCPAAASTHFFPLSILLILWACVQLEPVHRALSLYPLRFLGIVSYSLYLWHMVLIMTGMPIAVDGTAGFPLPALRHTALEFYLIYPASLVFYSACSYALIERPFLLLRRKAVPVPAVALRLDARAST
jgi:peptidoglycan/LPS O-acetylase OafA/YrhL